MRVFLASEFRCHIYKGEYYLDTKAFFIYKRYADAFGEIILCSRFVQTDNLMTGLRHANFIKEVICIKGLVKSLMGFYNNTIRREVEKCDIVIVRFPSIIAYKVADIAEGLEKRYIAELMCDGWDPYWNHGVLGKIIAAYMHFKMKSKTWNADYAIYVTEKFLQSRYPCKNPSIHASNVMIVDINQSILHKRLKRLEKFNKKKVSIMTTASVDLKSKGQQFVIKAMRDLKLKGIEVVYYLAGSGDKKKLLSLAIKMGVEKQVKFLGELPLEKVYEHLDSIDIYIQPSLQEGLPRAVIEAMSRGCICLGARTAGIPELLDRECVFEKSSSSSIVKVLLDILESDISKYAIKNFEYSKEYMESKLNKRRNNYFEKIKTELKNEVIQ